MDIARHRFDQGPKTGLFSRHSPDSGSLRDQDRPFGRLEQRQIAHRVRGRRSKPPVDRTEALKRAALPGSRRTSAAVVCCICRQRSSCRRRRCPQPGDQRQDFLEHLPRHRDLGHLEGHVAAVADDLGADLDQLLPQAGQRPRLRGLLINYLSVTLKMGAPHRSQIKR